MSKAIVYIEEMDSVADVTFPAVPTVVSLLMYDDTARARDNPHPSTGYPIVCVTVSGGHRAQTHTHAECNPLDTQTHTPHIQVFNHVKLATRSEYFHPVQKAEASN
jgi:hypothetical protein